MKCLEGVFMVSTQACIFERCGQSHVREHCWEVWSVTCERALLGGVVSHMCESIVGRCGQSHVREHCWEVWSVTCEGALLGGVVSHM